MFKYFFTRIKVYQYLLLIIDVTVIVASIIIAYSIRIYLSSGSVSIDQILQRLDNRQIFVVMIHLFSLYVFDFYNPNRLLLTTPLRMLSNLLIALIGGVLVISGVYYFFPKYIFGRQVLLIYLIVVCCLMPAYRLFSRKIYIFSVKEKKLVAIGATKKVTSFVNEFRSHQYTGVRIINWICIDEIHRNGENDLLKILKYIDFDIIVYDITYQGYKDAEINFILKQKYMGKAIYDFSSFFKNFTGRVHLDYIDNRWIVNDSHLQGYENRPYVIFKRLFDLVLSIFLLFLTLPLILIVGITIKLSSKGPAFFIQKRVGAREVEFFCYKFRTMVLDAEKNTGPIWSKEGDNRTTVLGRFLRKTRLDELPQLFNILKGEMSFIGPRPIRKVFAERIAECVPFYNLRFNVKPGLTGWAQVNMGYCSTIEEQREKFMYELFYIQNMSLLIDMLILIKTIRKMLWAQGV